MSTLKIAVATHYAPNFKSVGEICDANREEYCNIHGYSYERKFGELTHYCYDKYDFVYKLLVEDKYDYVWWTDADGLITNFSNRIEDYVKDKKDFIISEDVNGINDGSFIVRNTDESIKFLKEILDNKEKYSKFAMQAQVFLNNNLESNSDLIELVIQRDINSYFYQLYNLPMIKSGQWQYGDWFYIFLEPLFHIDKN